MNSNKKNDQDKDNYVTSIVSTIVDPKFMLEYENWINEMNTAASQSVGFFSVDIIKPNDHIQPEYVVILKFNNYQNLKDWLNSDSYKKLAKKAKDYLVHMSDVQERVGMEIWFSRPDSQAYIPQPKYYKRVLMGLMVVYPLSTFIGMLLTPYIENLSAPVQTFIIIAIMSCLMTWPVMPYLTGWLTGWLYPKPN